MTPDISLL